MISLQHRKINFLSDGYQIVDLWLREKEATSDFHVVDKTSFTGIFGNSIRFLEISFRLLKFDLNRSECLIQLLV